MQSEETKSIFEPQTVLGLETVMERIKEKRAYLLELKKRNVFQFQDEIDGINQRPDHGWQIDFRHDNGDNFAAITIRPGDTTPFEVHGGICGRWYAEHGAWDNGIRGRLGWPISDELACGENNKISFFENGTIFWDAEKWDQTTPRSWEDSINWFAEEAARGHSWAQVFLGDCFLRGLGVSPDYGKAFKWFSAAKDNGRTDIEPALQAAARQFILSV